MTEIKDAFGRSVSRRSFLAGTAAGAVGSGALLAGCGSGQGAGPAGEAGEGGGGDAAAGRGGSVTWGAWANPGEAERFRQVSKDYESKHETKITFQIIPGADYLSKLLTQLAGGSA